MRKSKPVRRALAILVLSACATASASDKGPRTPLLPVYQQECGSCHLAYPPGMLPAGSWKRLMGSLDKHFGSDATLSESQTRDIGAWLQSHAGTYKRVNAEPPQDRISRSDWFLRKHRPGEVPPDAWKRPSVGSPANCGACHTQAAQGSFSEREIRIPTR